VAASGFAPEQFVSDVADVRVLLSEAHRIEHEVGVVATLQQCEGETESHEAIGVGCDESAHGVQHLVLHKTSIRTYIRPYILML